MALGKRAARSAGASSGAASQISKWRRRHCAVRGRVRQHVHFFVFPNGLIPCSGFIFSSSSSPTLSRRRTPWQINQDISQQAQKSIVKECTSHLLVYVIFQLLLLVHHTSRMDLARVVKI
ncbi:hypothetical protein BDA96_03G000200 [Sorghum bicolor]|uniref:Uncharacterized protein n=2 Tax=Sorghum bicolor TaxID=4558 RepID=A0A921R870_SORBI|nr:hypothetical protein BDA96_03G000200 [Sorghum bicolor]OQU86041.1 hypothetical protein SORBI_3003G000150 [Sorghum bicolor]